MPLESATFINGLNASNPVGASDPKSQGDDHLRLIKSTLLNTFPSLTGAVTATHTQLNFLTGATGLTGTGNTVRSASPTLTGPTIASGGLTVTSGVITVPDGIVDAIVKNKNASTARSTATYAADPHLVTASLAVGTYWVEILGNGTFNSATGGLKSRLGGTAVIRATNPDDSSAYSSIWDMQTGISESDIVMVNTYPTVGGGADAQSGVTSFNLRIAARVTITTAGTLQWEWAQNTASGTTTIQGATMVVRRIA